jgi:hypothetical protein
MRLLIVLLLLTTPALARDPDGKYAQANPSLHQWFKSLHNDLDVYCCAEADGHELNDDDWRHVGDHIDVFVEGVWMTVPITKVLKEPNRAGKPIVWYTYMNGIPEIKCFIPGVEM